MTQIGPKTSVLKLAAILTRALSKAGIEAVLSGGAVVSIYTRNKFRSRDLDFISTSSHDRITAVMKSLGFSRQGRNFVHPRASFSVEFPPGPLALGEREPVRAAGRKTVDGVTVKLLSPTQSVMDRLVWFYHNNDRQCLDQAVAICLAQKVNMREVRGWSREEGAEEAFTVFSKALRHARVSRRT